MDNRSHSENRPLLIAQLDAPNPTRGGDWHYRTFAPGQAMARESGMYVINLDNVHRRKMRILRECDVVVLNSVVDCDLLPLLRDRKARGLLTVYEVSDDVTAVPPWNPIHYFFQSEENQRLFARMAWSCDANQYSVDELRRIFGHLNGSGAVFHNQLSAVPPARTRRHGPVSEEAPLVIGWGGSTGHLEDMAAIARPLIQWIKTHPGTRIEIMGAESIWRLFDRLPLSRKRYRRPGSLAAYYAFLDGIDVGLAPLGDTGFNRSRSDVKFLEYAAHGVVPVVQELTPYLKTVVPGKNGLMFRDANGLVAALDTLYAQPDLRERIAAEAHRYATENRVQADHSQIRVDFYRQCISKLAAAPRSTEECAARFEEYVGCEGAEVTGHHAILNPTRYENLLHEGLTLSQQAGRPLEAQAALRAAAALEPEDYQPWLFLAAAASTDAVEKLGEALKRNPRSIKSWMALGVHEAQGGEPARAIEKFLAATESFPAYEAPHLYVASILRQLGAVAEAAQFECNAQLLFAPLMRQSLKAA